MRLQYEPASEPFSLVSQARLQIQYGGAGDARRFSGPVDCCRQAEPFPGARLYNSLYRGVISLYRVIIKLVWRGVLDTPGLVAQGTRAAFLAPSTAAGRHAPFPGQGCITRLYGGVVKLVRRSVLGTPGLVGECLR